MKVTIELTATDSLLEAARLLHSSLADQKTLASNILTGGVSKSCQGSRCVDKRSTSSDEKASSSKGADAIAKKQESLEIEDLRALAQEKCKNAGREAIKSLISSLGADNIMQLPKDKYQELYKQLQKL